MTYGRYQRRYEESECSDPCETQPDIMCGGGWRNSVYRHRFNLTTHGELGSPLGRLNKLQLYTKYVTYVYNCRLNQ